ncbi:hypothetical protein MZK47_01710 [Microbacterium aerolatum]|uniref:hypothetical protein n=1 Tax=Microbacterium aerolatum TaxID=153731 RepID=UPI0020015724|nr:hypothetical protein [Microbacterium aerolatum]MCK3768388.1 hypothetical protein [Microbacterium aerolatum]
MDQKPVGSEAPLTPPTAYVAQAYLDEIGAVVERREAHIDRRRMAWLALAEAIVLGVYLTVAMFGFGPVDDSSRFIVILVLLFIWIQLSGELRESYGGQARRVGASQWLLIALAILAGLSVGVGMWLQLTGATMPFIVRLVPGIVLFVVFGSIALRALLRAPRALPRESMPFTRRARRATVGLGVVMAIGVGTTAVQGPFGSLFALCTMVLILGWGIAAYVGGAVPALGAIWRWQQWTALAVGSATLAGMTLVTMHTDLVTGALATSAGVLVGALFVLVACIGGRNGS